MRNKIFKIILLYSIFLLPISAEVIEKCTWDNRVGTPCLIISKTPNTSEYSSDGVNKIVITKQDMINAGASDINDVLKLIPGLDVFQSGTKGQTTSIFTRGSESNHTLVLLNGIAINDQSVTDGLHDFGQDFIHSIQQIEVYKGSSGAHFGPNAIAGAINLITDINYTNSLSFGAKNNKNYSINSNYTKLIGNDWHLNGKFSSTGSETNSSIANGAENDGMKNYQINLNTTKWLDDDTKFKSTLYSRKTKTDYDGSSTNEIGFVSNNKMYAIQTTIEKKEQFSESDFKLHYHKYDREYANNGFLDEYYSQSIVAKAEKRTNKSKKLSYGLGGEYKYDWGNFENRGSYSASTKGHMKNLGFFVNSGYKFNENQILSIYLRSDDHNTTGNNETYKFNFTQFLGDFEFGGTHSTGMRNPTLYELYGTDNYGITGNINLKPEKSKTNEFFMGYNFSESIFLKSSIYKSKVFEQIETNSAYTTYENMKKDINQEGVENEILFKKDNDVLSIFGNFTKSRKTNGQAQSRRPDLAYGANYLKEIKKSPIGELNILLNYKHTGKYVDWDGAKNSKQKSTDILDISLNKKVLNNIISLNITNFLDTKYEKPATYSQDGRKIMFNFKSLY